MIQMYKFSRKNNRKKYVFWKYTIVLSCLFFKQWEASVKHDYHRQGHIKLKLECAHWETF